MEYPISNSEDTLKKLSRRDWLHNAAITATGAIVLPSFLGGCTKEYWNPVKDGKGGAPSTEPLTDFQLYSAAQNLLHMNSWITDVYPFCIEYEVYIYSLLKSGEKPSGWRDFIVDILIEIALAILEAAAEEVPGAGPAIAIAGENIKKWASGDRPANLDAEFAEFVRGHNQMQKSISDTLLTLADETDHYKNLREGFKEDIEFNGKKYSLRDLAGSNFPVVNKGTAYVALRTAAFDRFRRLIWNVMFIKAGRMTYSGPWSIYADGLGRNPTWMGRNVHYRDPRYKATYLRGFYEFFGNRFYYRYWYFEFDGLELSGDAANELFKDDTPGHIINPKGLFFRDYVFKQFHGHKPDFFGYHELRQEPDWGGSGDAFAFDAEADAFVFTGGDFPKLTQP